MSVKEVRQPTKTLLVAEFPSRRAVPWMAPQDADEDLFLALGPDALPDHRGGLANIAFVDGAVVTFAPADRPDCGPEWRRSLIRTDDRKIDPVE